MIASENKNKIIKMQEHEREGSTRHVLKVSVVWVCRCQIGYGALHDDL